MNKTTEALKMAIEALDESMPLVFGNGIALEMMKTPLLEVERKVNFHKKAINACKEALKSQEQVTYTHKWDRCGERCLKCGDKDWMGGACSVPDSQEQEPVAEVIEDKLADWSKPHVAVKWNKVDFEIGTKLYTHPAPSQEQAPVAWEWFEDRAYYDMYAVRQVGNRNFDEVIHVLKSKDAKYLCDWLNSLNTHPAQPLSDDEIDAIENAIWLITVDKKKPMVEFVYKFARAIEQALKEKNS